MGVCRWGTGSAAGGTLGTGHPESGWAGDAGCPATGSVRFSWSRDLQPSDGKEEKRHVSHLKCNSTVQTVPNYHRFPLKFPLLHYSSKDSSRCNFILHCHWSLEAEIFLSLRCSNVLLPTTPHYNNASEIPQVMPASNTHKAGHCPKQFQPVNMYKRNKGLIKTTGRIKPR